MIASYIDPVLIAIVAFICYDNRRRLDRIEKYMRNNKI